jgi:aminoglycoside 2'-N-acetyltransferase I
VRIRRVPTADLSDSELTALRRLMDEAFGTDPEEPFTDDDWLHALGGIHVIADADAADAAARPDDPGVVRSDRPALGIVGHASVVPRTLHAGGLPLRTGYVEAVATAPAWQGRGVGSAVMREIGAVIAERYELGALGTGAHHFYERLGWTIWQGPSSVRTASGDRPTPDDDGYVMVLRTPTSTALDIRRPISCEWRPGDAW